MLQHIWIAGALWITGVTAFVCRRERHTNPFKFWFEMLALFVVLAGLFNVVKIATWVSLYLLT